MRFLGHSTVRLELAGTVVLTDPVLSAGIGPLRRVCRPLDRADWADAELVLLSHLHGDHLHLPSLRRLRARVVVPRGAGEWLRAKGVRGVEELAPGEVLEHGDLRVTGVEAAHSGHRWGPRSTHGPQAGAMGHLLPVWGWGPTLGPGHLTPVRAAEAARLLRAGVAVPVHWGTLALAGLVAAPGRAGARMRRLLVEPPREFAAAVAAAGTPTDVLVTEPGEPVALPDRAGPPC
jgi:L-ascorbate metabolism protein UlaG (beta-lactamase superfamily)